jgi:hypothetical protein
VTINAIVFVFDVTPCSLVTVYQMHGACYRMEDASIFINLKMGCRTFIRNVGKFIQTCQNVRFILWNPKVYFMFTLDPIQSTLPHAFSIEYDTKTAI